MSQYKITVNNTQTFDLTTEDLDNFDSVSSGSKSHSLKDHQSFTSKIIQSNFHKKHYTVKVNSNTYEVVINNSLDRQIKAMGFETGKSKQVNALKAPMPGLVLKLEVKEGQEVKENDSLLILEAMKMENVMVSPRNGIIKSISVNQGDAIEKGQLLIEFE